MSVSITAQTKRGLVIGIGEQQDTCWAKINGDNDARYVKKMLERNGYKDICTLINRQATKKNIASAFNRLTRKCKAGDVVYIHFSGHGQQVRDLDGNRWIKCEQCGAVKLDRHFVVYGGRGKLNVGLCAECSRKH